MSGESLQCEGFTKKKSRCTRKVSRDDYYQGRLLCWQHMKEAKGGESDSDDRDFIVDDEEEYSEAYALSAEDEEILPGAWPGHRPKRTPKSTPSKPKPKQTPTPKRRTQQQRKDDSPKPPSRASSSSQKKNDSPKPPSRPSSSSSSSPKKTRPHRGHGSPLKKQSSAEELFDQFGRMNLVDDIPPEAAANHKKKEYSLFGGRVTVTKDTSGPGAHLNFALHLRKKEEALKNKLLHRYGRPSSSSSSPSPPSGPVAPDAATYNGTSMPLTLPQTTADYFNWIPKDISPETAAKLLHEVLQPVSSRDVPGYIYMCWVTPDVPGHARPTRNFAERLIPSSKDDDANQGGSTILPDGSKVSTAEVMQAAGVPPRRLKDKHDGRTKDCIILKIGRAVDVEQRMKQWKDQCAHTLTLMRYYPYYPGQPLPDVFSDEPDVKSRGASVDNRKVPRDQIIPHCHKVEHLIHVELDELR
ncbi:hypothetical protein KEM55_002777, partial [Ascosphaera atra]